MTLTKVTMNLSDGDRANTEFIHAELGTRSKAQVVSIGLSLLGYIVREMKRSRADLLLRHSNGSYDRVVVPELESYKENLAHPLRGVAAHAKLEAAAYEE